MSVTEARFVADDGDPDVADGLVVDAVVERLHREYGGDPLAIRSQVAAALATFADASVKAFVPILVEKQVRQRYRRHSGRLAAPPG